MNSKELASSAFRIGINSVITFEWCDQMGVIKVKFIIVVINEQIIKLDNFPFVMDYN